MINQTDQMMYRLNNLDTLQQKLNYQYAGKKLEYGSDDSVLYSRIISVDDKVRVYEGIKTQVERTTVQNKTSDSSMAAIKKILESINAELIKANTDTTSEDGLKAIATNLSGMKENLLDLANTQVEGEYVFAGSDSSIKPFEVNADGSISYNGDNKLRRVTVEEGSYRERGINGFDVMMYSSATAYKNESLTFNESDRVLDQDGNEWVLDNTTDPVNPILVKYDVDGNQTTDTMPVTFDPTTNTYETPIFTANGTKFEAKTSIFTLIDNVVNSLNKVDSSGNPISISEAKDLISKGAEEIMKAYDGVNIAHADLGSKNKIFEVSLENLTSKITQYNVLSQELSASDYTEIALKAKALELTYTALYSTINKTNQLSLVNFLNN
ncbi:MAG: flagellar hook-associated protein FlgL [Arcobacter sp.]|jgi:flagellar hook-associated protein 3 FlgL|uniref:Distal flagellar hook-filament junction protein n=1 Tax=Arcobacter defluvii TaxID=873191 RepID=A0AAE7BI98_9BACT|nr:MULTISPECIES: flagellar hook-associated protein FlgL [Arcobacter]MDY3201025.1 flagellar hook-associated protein FlgL [Arcobacter sp.]QKF78464.1 distal flagellar hook-filament junction protein [Arcobacter defluvii]RXI31340.1 flagellar hook-associated protein 3 [Arcobacter defluvii]